MNNLTIQNENRNPPFETETNPLTPQHEEKKSQLITLFKSQTAPLLEKKIPNTKQRNHRIITNSNDIQKKLKKQLQMAEVQYMNGKNSKSPSLTYVNFDHTNRAARGFESYTEKPLKIREDVHCSVEVAQLLGDYKTQEDCFIATSFEILTPDGKSHTALLTGIFDGHGGKAASLFMKKRLKEKLQNTFASLFDGTLETNNPLKKLGNVKTLSNKVIWNVLKIVCVELHEEYVNTNSSAGTTASFSLIIDGDDLWHANVGDSRSFITNHKKTIQLSEDMGLRFAFKPILTEKEFNEKQGIFHLKNKNTALDLKISRLEKNIQDLKATATKSKETLSSTRARKSRLNTRTADLEREIENKKEKLKTLKYKKINPLENSYEKSVWKRDGFVCSDRRVNGVLAPARAVGDGYLGSAVCPRPKIVKISLSKKFPFSDACFLMEASDGLWDTTTTSKVSQIIKKNAARDLSQIVKNLVYSSVHMDRFHNDNDNISIVMTKLNLQALRKNSQNIG